MRTPWGASDNEIHIAPGVTWVSTPSHGGIMIERGVARQILSTAARAIGEPFNRYLAFEEDCNWAAYAYEHPIPFQSIVPEQSVEQIVIDASRCLHYYHPEYFDS